VDSARTQAVNGLLTTLMLFALGLGLRTMDVLDEAAAGALAKYVVKVAMPALLLTTFLEMQISAIHAMTFVLAAVLAYAIGVGFLPAVYIFSDAPEELRGLLYTMAMGWNIGLFAFPLVKLLYGPLEFEYIALFDIPNVLINFGISYAVAVFCAPPEDYLPLADGPEQLVPGKTLMHRICALSPARRVMILKKILTYPPLFWGMLGLSLNLSGLNPPVFPPVFYSALKLVGDTTTSVPLVTMGLLTNVGAVRMDKMRILGKLLALRTVPPVLIGAYVMTNPTLADTTYTHTLLLGLIMPVPFCAIPYSNELGYDATFAATAVVSSTLLSFVLVVVHVYLSA
jgi:hypothetical protein